MIEEEEQKNLQKLIEQQLIEAQKKAQEEERLRQEEFKRMQEEVREILNNQQKFDIEKEEVLEESFEEEYEEEDYDEENDHDSFVKDDIEEKDEVYEEEVEEHEEVAESAFNEEEFIKKQYMEELEQSNIKDKELVENLVYMMNIGYSNFRVNYNLLIRSNNDLVIAINKLCNNLVTDSMFEIQ